MFELDALSGAGDIKTLLFPLLPNASTPYGSPSETFTALYLCHMLSVSQLLEGVNDHTLSISKCISLVKHVLTKMLCSSIA